MNCSNPKIKEAAVFHDQGPQFFDYSIRLNHTWAFSGFPDVKSIMDANGPQLNDLELYGCFVPTIHQVSGFPDVKSIHHGVNTIPTMQYSFSGFLTFQQVLDSFIIFAAQQSDTKNIELPSSLPSGKPSSLKVPWMSYGPSNIRIVPFPTREYTDDEFQSIIKSIMGV
ncbi:ABC transporter A family member 1-like, partial [Prunus avium]|uniref:ABC transporter A family member 1-like n=1 Tax=Prunus avium TaxID=42229 RepID=A0A6P5TT52_PRUAV